MGSIKDGTLLDCMPLILLYEVPFRTMLVFHAGSARQHVIVHCNSDSSETCHTDTPHPLVNPERSAIPPI
jgi:hypothetical protein